MGFLWSEIGLELSLKSFRYHNDLIWYVYSLVGLVPLILMTLYKVMYKKYFSYTLTRLTQQVL